MMTDSILKVCELPDMTNVYEQCAMPCICILTPQQEAVDLCKQMRTTLFTHTHTMIIPSDYSHIDP